MIFCCYNGLYWNRRHKLHIHYAFGNSIPEKLQTPLIGTQEICAMQQDKSSSFETVGSILFNEVESNTGARQLVHIKEGWPFDWCRNCRNSPKDGRGHECSHVWKADCCGNGWRLL